MAEKSSPSEWLPAGWSWTVKTSKNGRKYKVYTDPSHKLKFLSKPEVIRYLNSVESGLLLNAEDNSDDSGHSKSVEESKEIIVHSDKNVVVEEAVAEGLPPGWIKEVRVTQRGKSIRRDLYYTDPISGYVFLSLKDCKRYLKTGILGKSSYKPKDKDHIDMELENDNISSPAMDQGNEVQDGGTDKPLMSNEDLICSQYPNSDHGRSDVTGSDLNSQSTKSLEQIEGKGDSNIHTLVSSPVVEDYPKRLLESGVGIHEIDKNQHTINKSNSKRSSDFPRRASKRLAGVELDPVPEPKTDDRTRRSAGQRSGEAATRPGGNTHDLPAIKELPGKFGLETMASEQQRLSTALPLANLPNSEEPVVQEKKLQISEERAGEMEPSPISKEQASEEKPLPASGEQDGDGDSMMIFEEEQGEKEKLLYVSKEQATEKEHANEIDALLESSANFSMEDLWQDPCIEFAIKTLTGVIPIGEENQAEKNSGSSAEMSFPIAEENQAEKNSGSSAEMSFPIAEENQAEKNSGSSAEMSFSDIWTDPCYQFAVKTLTGDIPLDEDPSIQNLFQQQVSSADTRGVGAVVLPNMNTFCQRDYTSQLCNAVEKPQNSKQQATAASRIPQTSTRSFQISGGSGLHQSIQDKTSGQCP
ncbi:MBD domain-containing protein [Heracleum sosnowskyi]|uniref:MBD domain-containing protein n=1 Tax=Heracleum sosnowskyi TaxID=360622 RepID=A0AAD8HHA0_9APIA|nr:MBD domain-containing protein [Heracleum sosnowskyi]